MAAKQTTQSPSNNQPKTAKEKVQDFLEEQLKIAEEMRERMPEWEAEAEDRISYCKVKLMKLEPFFGMLLMKMPTMPSYQIPTAATDGTHLLYNPKFIAEDILRKDLTFILLHEIAHVFWKHNIRGPIKAINVNKIFERQQKLKEKGIVDDFLDLECKEMQHKLKEWNFATDYVINEHIDKHVKSITPSEKLKKELLFNNSYGDHTSEAIYDKIKTPYDPDEDDQDMGLGIGGILPAGFGELTEEEAKTLEKEFEQEVQGAAVAAARAGKLPAGIADAIESMYKTQTPWQDVFRTIFTSINKQDYTFQYPNKRYTSHMMDHGVVMPSLWGEEYVDCGFIMDTSGSVGREEKQILASELKNILEDYNIKLHVLYCDSDAYVDDVQILTREDIREGALKLDVKGGGGTNMRPGFDYFRKHQNEFDFQTVICLTDMYLFDWGKLGPEPEFSTYWARLPRADRKVVPDFGTCIDIQVEEKD